MTGVGTLEGLQYKLQMIEILKNGVTNPSVINNISMPESTLKKKNSTICYDRLNNSVAIGQSLTAHIDRNENHAYLLTKF